MTTFALIHGAWHGAWCWEPLIPELERRGHRAVAVDLPCDDPSAATMDDARLIADSLADVGDDVVVVGHSLGAITAAVVPLLRPVRRVVFLTALVPRPGLSLGEVMGSEPDTTTEEFNALPRHVGEGGSVTWDPAVAGPFFYRACPPGTADWASPTSGPRCGPRAASPAPSTSGPIANSSRSSAPTTNCSARSGRAGSPATSSASTRSTSPAATSP